MAFKKPSSVLPMRNMETREVFLGDSYTVVRNRERKPGKWRSGQLERVAVSHVSQKALY